ncbi:AzlC family ABC transporter permease [Limosilactobacillus antri]|uniref:Branched-chain amino acid transporter AzlC n=1 Tax=Limosilactobacillus antri DSM 16041 TaxID=525309 RepID=C8P441_9LACO|nr:AzlC family ABC transporter permease [Limosilactobacillus antri]EEW54708.1 putative azaleucine resistance protein AzlC [Limosilactobacillus antri DSM 16041]KRK60638.1 branched-chain amino acid transporter AzlC [Limosilactobacillus antri DSM 16041]
MEGKVSNFRYAWTASIPVLFGYVTLGFAYGLYMHNLGFAFWYPALMALTIYGGSVEFFIANLLLQHFNPLNVLLITAVLGFRQFFYGVAMLTKYPHHGWQKWLLIFGLSDETFVLNYYTKIPDGYDPTTVRTWISVLDYFYWALGALSGGCLGGILNLQVKGLDFVMTALFLVLAVEQILKEKDHWSALSGFVITIACLLVVGKSYFMIVTLLLLVLEYYWFGYRERGRH